VIRRNKSLWALAFALAIALAFCVQPAAAQMNIGSAAVIRNDVQGVRGSATRVLASGGSVFSDDQVKTGDDSLAQLVFLDQTNLTVAANSQAVLREVYRPKQGFKQLVLKTVTGSFRFVSGAQSRHHYEVQFPQGYLTVRGTTLDIVAGQTRTIIIVIAGAITVVPNATGLRHNVDAPMAIIVYNDGHVEILTREAAVERFNLKVATEFGPPNLWPTEQVASAGFTGFDVGGFVEGAKSSNTYKVTQAATGEEIERNSFGTTEVGGGGHVGFIIPVVTNAQGGATALGPFIIEPFVQIEDPNISAQFNFPRGSFIGVTSNFEVTTGVKAGPTLFLPGGTPVWLYGTLAASFENDKLTINFVPISSSEDKTIAGLTIGIGGAIMPAGLQLFGMPTAFSVEYQHTFWQTAHFDMPASSSSFNFTFPRDDDKVMVGLHVFIFHRAGGEWQPQRETVGFEKSFLGGDASVGVRVPSR
jgi:hypothetical protein